MQQQTLPPTPFCAKKKKNPNQKTLTVLFVRWFVSFFIFSPFRPWNCCTAQSSPLDRYYMNLGLFVGSFLFLSLPYNNYSAQHCFASCCGWVERDIADSLEALVQPANQTYDPPACTQEGKCFCIKSLESWFWSGVFLCVFIFK